ncbi:MAG: FMN-binding protein [Deltaproteobacteria bacterium]|nr:FMN-binding protein [Deltaproteobacteria bacterium]
MASAWHFNLVIVGLSVLVTWALPTIAAAKAFYSKQEALALAFPEAEHVETKTVFLTDDQVHHVSTLASAPVDSKLATIYVGRKAGQVLGYAFIETNVVRTLPETFLIVVSPTGTVQKLFVLAFYEPEEYTPSTRWLQQFDQKALTPTLQVRQDIHGIVGATLSSRAITNGVRKVLSLFQVVVREGHQQVAEAAKQ